MKTSRFEKLIAMVLACLMLLTSVPVEMLLTANASDVRGIGVVNTVRTDNENVVTPYRIIIKKNNTEISQRFTVTSTNGKTITVYSDGTFELDNGDGVNFSDSQEFIDLINSYGGVTSVEIKIDDQDNSYYVYDHNNSDKDGFLYSDFVWQYTYEENVVDPETGEPVIDPETGEIVTQTITIPVTYDPTKPKLTYNGYEFDNPNYDYTVKNIRSTFMQRYTVDVLWRDRNENSRPDPDFTVTQTKQDDASYSRTISESPYHTNVSSNEDTYTYRVPEKDKDGKKYIYTAAPSDPGSDYRVEALPDGKTIIYYGLTDYTATLMWLDGASGTYNSVFADDDDKTEKQKVAEYVFENFKLISKSLDENEPDSDLDLAGYAAYSGYDETEEAFLVKDKNGRILHKIIYDPATKELRITGIDQIEYIEENQTSVVRSYYLQCVDETGTADIPDTDDFWGITAVNSGLETNETRKAYSGSTIVNTLTGTQDIYTNIRWLDEDKVSERVGNDGSNQGQIVLWRYANNTDTDKLDRTAQVMTLPLVQTEEITQDETTVTVPARDENGNLIFLDRVTFRNLPKYDQQGYPYVYYMKENLPSHLIGAGYVSNIDNSTATPDGGVGYPQGSHGTSDIIKPGGTAVNKLTGVLAYQIDATWIAAARQGGTDVAVRYTILKENDDGTWERAEGKDPATGLDTDAELLVTGFNAENMSKTVSLPTVSAYDENGKAINYKVVQTFVTRNDNHVTGTCEDEFSLGSNGEAYTGTMHLTHNGESVDDYIINIKPKTVEGADNPLYIVFEYTLIGKKTLNLKKQWNAEHTETEVKVKLKYFDFADKKYKDYMENGEVKYFLIHESDKEYNNTEWTKSVQVDAYDEGGHELEYEMVEVEPTEYGRAYSFDRAASLYTVANSKGGDNGVEIDLKKQWQVDGEMEYRTAIKIDVDSDAIGDDYGRKPETPTNIDVNLNETDFWEGEVPTYYDYVYDPNDFKEHTTSGTAATDYETLEQVVNGRTTYTDGSEWLYKMLSTKYTSGNVVNMADEYKIQFGKAPNIYFAGIYNDGNYYYAVEQIPDLDPEHNPNKKRPSEIQFINTRVGVVSYEISFDWQVGNWLGEGKDVEFKIFANGVERFDPITMHVTSGQAKYYITNLPKYDEMGKIIDYTIQEYTIDGHPVRNGVCEWDNNDGTGNETCIVTMTENGYVNGQNHHSDDLVKVKFTNTFSASRNYTVYKRWKDGDISSSERPDVYLRLWKITNANGGTRTYEDYSWSDNNHEVPNSWSYTFSNIPKYDEHGYKYTYYIEEFPVNGYEITYDNSRNNVESLRDDTTCAYNGGIITNTRVGDVIINGEKAWNNIAPIFAKQYYPVADIYLYRKKHNTTYEDVTEGDRLIQSGSYGELLSATKVFNGDTTFHFTEPCAYGVGIGLETDDTAYSNLIFPRFDEDGYEYVYTLRERSINGYVSEIKGETIVNNYVANEKVSVKVTKYWEHMHANSVYPTSTIILHQVVWARIFDDETGDFEKENGEYVYYPIEYASYKKTPNSQNECLFTELPKYAPDGSEFAFYVTEELNNYIRDPVQFNTYSGDNANKINVNGILGPYNDTGHGFKSVITDVTDVSGQTYDKEATVTNKYMPDLDNFNGQIKVNKSWNYHSENYNNTSEFSKIKGYTFTVERYTTKILTEQLLTVDTNLSYDSEGNEGGVLPKVTILSNDTLHLTTPMAAYDADDSIIENPAANSSQISYYKAVYESYIADQQQKILFTVTITDTNGNRDVLLSGLAIYAQDSVKYTYRVSESAGTPFTLSEASQNTAIPQQIPISDIPDEERITYDLTNELRVFNLRLNKTFSKYFVDENGQTKHSPITHEEEEQFFNRAYLNQLKFNLYRSTTSPVDTSDTAVPYMANISGSDLRWDNEQGDVLSYDQLSS